VDVGVWRARVATYRAQAASTEPATTPAAIEVPKFIPDPQVVALREGSDEAKLIIGKGLYEESLAKLIASGATVTDVGLQAACSEYLSGFFAKGFEAATRAKPLFALSQFEGLLREVLADRFEQFRFRNVDDPQLASLSEAQKKEWKTPRQLTSTWIAPESLPPYAERMTIACETGRTIRAEVEAAIGQLPAVLEQHRAAVEAARALAKTDPGWIAAGQVAGGWALKVNLLQALEKVGRLSASSDPRSVERLQTFASRDKNGLSPEQRARLIAALDLGGIKFESGQSLEDPPAALRFALAAISCMQWPKAQVLSECTDANKHLLYTMTDNHAVVSGTLRIVERYDGIKKRGPMLLLERLYPDLNVEGKRRLIEHAIQRAAAMRMPLALAQEYFWSCDHWDRVGVDGTFVKIPSMNVAISELAAKYDAKLVPPIKIRVKATMGPFGAEYLDSAPQGGATKRGERQDRSYEGGDVHFDNLFVVLLPRRPGSLDP
jgi:hypothetical protein